MAIQPTFHATRPSLYSWFESITEISILGSTIIEGLGLFGLAVNGMCPALRTSAVPVLPATEAPPAPAPLAIPKSAESLSPEGRSLIVLARGTRWWQQPGVL
jgi:hypothetical protein